MRHNTFFKTRIVSAILALLFLCACTQVAVREDGHHEEKPTTILGYRLGPPARYDNIKTLAIPRIKNETREPHLETEMTSLIIDEFVREQTYTVVPHTNTADGVLYVTLRTLDMSTVRWIDRSQDKQMKGVPIEFRIRLVADVRMENPHTQNLIWQHRGLTGRYEFESAADFGSAKRDAILEASKDLALRINQAAVERW